MARGALINLSYLAASVLFIFCLKGLSHPRTAVRGNLLGALGMLLAVAVTLVDRQIVGFGVILAGMLAGSAVGALFAVKVPMTGMPQMVALFNGFGGGASVLVAGASLLEMVGAGLPPSATFSVAVAASGIIIVAAFHLWALQRVFLGPLNPKYAQLEEINSREIFCLAPLAAIALFLGVYPMPILNLMSSSLVHLVDVVKLVI